MMQGVDVEPEVDFDLLAEKTVGYSGDDITGVCRDAAMNGMRRKIMGKTPEQIRCVHHRALLHGASIIVCTYQKCGTRLLHSVCKRCRCSQDFCCSHLAVDYIAHKCDIWALRGECILLRSNTDACNVGGCVVQHFQLLQVNVQCSSAVTWNIIMHDL